MAFLTEVEIIRKIIFESQMDLDTKFRFYKIKNIRLEVTARQNMKMTKWLC